MVHWPLLILALIISLGLAALTGGILLGRVLGWNVAGL